MSKLADLKRREDLDSLIERVTEEMTIVGPTSEEYPKLLENLERLTKLRSGERPERVSRDTVALVAGNIVGILVIVAYEQKHVVTSKAFGTFVKSMLR